MIALDTRFMDFSSSLRSQSELKFTLLFVKFKTHGKVTEMKKFSSFTPGATFE